jgi:hypothetical protein
MYNLSDRDREWLSKRFSIQPEEILWHHSGICYDRIMVKSKESADKVSASVKGETVNGGWFHGMSLGGQAVVKYEDNDVYEVMC